jgi:hypothetical protein
MPFKANEIIGVVYLKRKRKSFYYLIEPFALGEVFGVPHVTRLFFIFKWLSEVVRP